MAIADTQLCGPAGRLQSLSDIRDPLELRINLVRMLAGPLIGADDGGCSEIDLVERTVRWRSIRPLPGAAERMKAASQYCTAHPLLAMHRQSTTPTGLRLTDAVSPDRFEYNPFYENVYRPIGMKFQLLARLNDGPRFRAFGLLRARRDFSNRQLQTFRLIIPLAAMLIRAADERELLHRVLNAQLPNRGMIQLRSDRDEIAWADPLAQRQLKQFFPSEPSGSLPKAILDWIACHDKPFLCTTPDARLRISLYRSGQQRLLVCEQLPPEPSPRILQKLGLTPRQAEVLFWISQGKTNAEIGVILNASVHTISRHVEAIFHRLHVESRSSAMVLALEALKS